MDRRVAGIAVLVLALIAVVVAPSIGGRRTVGTAVALRFSDPPAVGDCVSPLPVGSVQSNGRTPELPDSTIPVVPCDGSIGGEVVGVWMTPAAAQADQAGSRRGGPCYWQAAAFAGLQRSNSSTDVFGSAMTGPVYWKPTIGFDPINIVPDPVAVAGGQQWVACLVVPTKETSYRGTLQDAFTSGRMPDGFGLCWDRDDLDYAAALVPCNTPHPAELLATGWVQNRALTTLSAIQQSCVAVAGRIMRTADPTRAGAISIVTDPVRLDGAAREDAPLAVNCFAAAVSPQQLTGTVIGLADGPLPLVG